MSLKDLKASDWTFISESFEDCVHSCKQNKEQECEDCLGLKKLVIKTLEHTADKALSKKGKAQKLIKIIGDKA